MLTPTETSPYELLQERFREEPWKLLVVCMMLNQTSAKQVKGIIGPFFEKYPNPELAEFANPIEMAELIRTLGLHNRRARAIIKMSVDFREWTSPRYWPHGRQYMHSDWLEVQDFYGIGKYAADSYRIFVIGELVEDVEDKELRRYVEWAKTKTS